MASPAQPQPAQLPLPGGREGATVRLHPLLAGEMLTPSGFLDRPGGPLAVPRVFAARPSSGTWIPIPAFLVEHPTAGPVLVDTGLHPSVAEDPGESFGPGFGRVLRFRVTAEQALRAQLRARGVQPDEVRVVVITHLHFDHASGVSELPQATFVLDRAEWAAATGRAAWREGYLSRQFGHDFDWRALDYEAPAIDSHETFGRAVDLFGDGSVRLLSTPGHTAGHQSVLLRLSGRQALLTGDAAYLRRTITEGAKPLLVHDGHRFQRSLGEIRHFLDQAPDTLVVPGHDAEAWRTLQDVYE